MNVKHLYASLIFLLICFPVQAQLMEKLKEKAKEKGIETSDKISYDSTAYDPNLGPDEEEDNELQLNSAQDFFTTDVVMALYNDGQLVQTSYFDNEPIAMRTEQVASAKPLYHDSKGMMYGYNADNGYYEKMSILPASSMGFMTAGITTQAYKLPTDPYFEAFKALSEMDIALNFLILEMAFVYKPKHFKDNEYYLPSPVSCNNSTSCLRFSYNDPQYPGSYIQFDDQGRLNELYINSNLPAFDDKPKGKFVYSYKDCTVELPDAVELEVVPGPLGKIMNINDGLEPWKKNKEEKQKKKQKDN